MEYMFYDCINFNQNVMSWDTSNVRNINDMFYNCVNFNKNIG